MGLREFLRVPKIRLRKKSKARSEIAPIEGPSAVDPAGPHLAGSTPDLRTGSSTSATPTPLASLGQGFKGTGSNLFHMAHLTSLFLCNPDRSDSDRIQPVSNEEQSDHPGPSSTDSKPGRASENNPNLEVQGGGGNEIPSGSDGGPGNIGPPKTRVDESAPDTGIGSPPPPTSHSTPHVQDPKGTQTAPSQTTHLTPSPRVTDRSMIDPIQSLPSHTQREQSGSPEDVTEQDAAGESKSNLGSLVVSAAKLTLRGVKEAADAFPPLKAVAGGLCFILDNCEVRFVSYMSSRQGAYARSANDGVSQGSRIVVTSDCESRQITK